MKHNIKITLVLLSMFLITQFIGLFVISQYAPEQKTVIDPETGKAINITTSDLPIIFQSPTPETETGFIYYLIQLIPSFIIAILLVLILTKYKLKFVIKTWFFLVVIMALYLAINAFAKDFLMPLQALIISLAIAIPLAYIKIYKPRISVHNITELLIYPGISAVFVPLLSPLTIIILLIMISIYDMWAVWHSGIMQKMAKYQMEELKIFGGFLVPYMDKKTKAKIRKAKKSKKKNKKIKVSLAILGGGDVVFPIITAGVFLLKFGILSALSITIGSFIGLSFLFFITQKGKFYPAMPFITAGIFLGMTASWILGFI